MIRTTEEKAAEIIRLEILLGTIDRNANFNQYLKVLRKIQKLRDSLWKDTPWLIPYPNQISSPPKPLVSWSWRWTSCPTRPLGALPTFTPCRWWTLATRLWPKRWPDHSDEYFSLTGLYSGIGWHLPGTWYNRVIEREVDMLIALFVFVALVFVGSMVATSTKTLG